jgi:holin-like protein
MVGGLTILLLFQLAGELIATGFDLPIPGPVIGMGLLFVALLVRGSAARSARSRPLSQGARGLGEGLERAAQGLLNQLSLLFIPAGCGIITHLALIRDEWLPITVSLVGSTLIAIAVTALTMQALLRLQRARQEARQGGG